MLDNEDLKWIAATSTDLNAKLQQIARYSDLARQHKGEYNYISILGERVEAAAKTAQSIFDRVTSKIFDATTGKSALGPTPTPSFTVVRSSSETLPSLTTEKTTPAMAAPPPLPAKSSEQKKRPDNISTPAKPEIKNREGERELILIVDDETQVAELAGEMLAEEGYKTILAHDGFEALKIYEQMGKDIGLVILDFFLPVMDGDAVFDELRNLNPDINVVLSSGFAEQNKLGHMLAQGLRGFIPKPYSRAKLLEQVRTTLDSAKQVAR
jgi:CheY-like chemotaxis protein